MKTRRQFVKLTAGFVAGIGVLINPWLHGIQSTFAAITRTVLPAGTKLKELVLKEPKTLDTRNLEPTPLPQFKTMGKIKYKVDLETWRLEVKGKVKKPFSLSYEEIKALPTIEREVLMICPGFFAQHGRWKGPALSALIKKAEPEPDAVQVVCLGVRSTGDKKEEFTFEEVNDDRIFLAYNVNGEPLPEKHGFPLRVVAEDHVGDDWVKFVHTIEVV